MKSIYGNTVLLKALCPICKEYNIVIDGVLTCCKTKLETKRVHSFTKRETNPRQQRKNLPVSEKQRILKEQNYSCIYCTEKFGSYVARIDKVIKVRAHFDHVIPYSFAQNNHKNNFVAACSICNGIKHDFVFETLEEARKYIMEIRDKKRYTSLKTL
jgi:5-methylcytosine-specific restriction endonuclease McrA